MVLLKVVNNWVKVIPKTSKVKPSFARFLGFISLLVNESSKRAKRGYRGNRKGAR